MTSQTTTRNVLFALVFASPWFAGQSAFAHSEEAHDEEKKTIDYANAEEHEFGTAADPSQAARTITIEMSDEMRFTPDVVEVKAGEIVRFDIHNKGQLLHELVLGTTEDLETHAALMKKFPGMEHDEPHMAHVGPGNTGEIGWRFKNAGEYYYGCLLPGHFDAGMKGKVVVR